MRDRLHRRIRPRRKRLDQLAEELWRGDPNAHRVRDRGPANLVCRPLEVWSVPDLGLVRRREGTAFAEASLNGGIRSVNATQTSDFEHNSLRDGALCGPPSSGQQAKEAGCRGGPYGA